MTGFFSKYSGNIKRFLMLFVAVMSAMPSLYICRYLYPVQDDYHYAYYARELMNQGHNLLTMSIHEMIDYYQTFSGCYSSTFLGYFFSGIAKCEVWPIRIICLISISLFYIALYCFCLTVFCDVFHIMKTEATWLYLLVHECITGVSYYADHSDFYWFITAIQYLFITSCILFGISLAVKGICNNKRTLIALAMFFAIIGSGAALNIAALCVCLYGCVWLWGWFVKRKRKSASILFFTSLIFAVINGLAPGNYIRKGSPVTINLLLDSLGLSYRYLLNRYIFLMKTPLFILIVVALIMTLIFIKFQNIEMKYSMPILAIFIIESIVAAVIFPVMVGYGWDVYQIICRCNFISDLILFICTFVSALYLKGWFNKHKIELVCSKKIGFICTLVFCVFSAIFLNKQWKRGTAMNRINVEIKNGLMEEYSDYAVEIINQTKNSKEKVVKIYIPIAEDRTCLIDAQYTVGDYDQSEYIGNRGLEAYYYKDAVCIYPIEQE